MLGRERAAARRPCLFVVVGLPGSGKATRAREIAAQRRALRLTPDEWLIPLVGGSDAGGTPDLLEGRLIRLALQALAAGVDVVLDVVAWGRTSGRRRNTSSGSRAAPPTLSACSTRRSRTPSPSRSASATQRC